MLFSDQVENGQIIDLKIESLATGGSGVARWNSMVIFVPYTAPGDEIQAKILSVKKRFAEAELVKILRSSPSRRIPECPVFGICGGCTWQHVKYSEQLRQKTQIVERGAKKINPNVLLEPIVPSPTEWQYRHRVQVHLNRGKVGFLKRKSNEVVDINSCFIATKKINETLDILREQRPADGKYEIADRIEDAPEIIDLRHGEYLFFQANMALNQALVDRVLALSEPAKYERIFDLYCGSGNFSFPLAAMAPKSKVTAVELEGASIALAKKTQSSSGGPPNLEFHGSDVHEFLRRLHTSADLVVTDPPRTGMDPKVIDGIARLGSQRVVYISCDPVTFFRDVKVLTDISPLQLKTVAPFDMFPQTDHVELIGILEP